MKMKMKMKNVHKLGLNAQFAVLSWRCSNFERADLRLKEKIMMLMVMVMCMLM